MRRDPFFVGVLRLAPDELDPALLVVQSKTFAFYDRDGVIWRANAGDIVGGAHIPGVLKPLFGRSFQEPTLRAAVLHDIYCASKVRTWRATTTMFYWALITSGVSVTKSHLMWAGVYAYYLFGPHWPDPRTTP